MQLGTAKLFLLPCRAVLPLPTSQPNKKRCGRKQHDVHAKSECQLRTKMQMLNVNCLLGLCCPCLLCATVQKEIQSHRKKTWRSRRPPALKTRIEFKKHSHRDTRTHAHSHRIDGTPRRITHTHTHGSKNTRTTFHNLRGVTTCD